MKDKKRLIIGVIVVVLLVVGGVFIFTKQDKNTSFTILEKQWLENNKTKVIDISIIKDIPVISYNGSGILFDFLSDFEDVTGLSFNPIAYTRGDDIKSDYSFQVVSQKSDNDILVCSDNYALLTSQSIKYNKLSEIEGMVIGVLESDLEKVENAMDSVNVEFKTYASISELVDSLSVKMNENGEEIPSEVNAIVLPKISNYALILSNDNLNISYNINEIKEDYVFHLGNDEKLNDIIIKYFTKWNELKYKDSFDKHFSNNYFTFSNTDEKSKAEFKSKRYIYGYVEKKPYDSSFNNDFYGINKSFLANFADVADIDIQYNNYADTESLVAAFNDSSIDLFFDNLGGVDYSVSFVDLVSNYDEQVAVLALPTNKVTVSSVKSLVGYDVAVIANTKIASFLEDKGVSVKAYSSISELLSKIKDSTIIVLDSEVYNFYSSNELNEYKCIYLFEMDSDYSFKVVNNDSNSIFIKYFNFYLSFVSSQEVANAGYFELLSVTNTKSYVGVIIFIISLLVLCLIAFLIYQNRKNNKSKTIVVKDNKIKYIDVLTSLKNRNYLNDNIDAWDESLVYPQGLVVVDLNNIAYINDNYGHAEGDKVIKEAANILIKTQISNTEIMRTNGNEFLIYMVGYDEKQIVSYIRKLNKELKDLSHSFGAAIGYSIITDEIKTIDDAINEATLDMKNNKQESTK